MSQIGFYRYKIEQALAVPEEVKFFVNGILTSTATIIPRINCGGQKLIKYLDSSGRYRVFSFNNYWQQSNKPKEIGTINVFYPSLTFGQSESKSIGYTNTKTLTLSAENVSDEELEILEDIYSSPRVYLYVGRTGGDTLPDWILVSVSGDGIGRRKKKLFGKVTITVDLPKQYCISLM